MLYDDSTRPSTQTTTVDHLIIPRQNVPHEPSSCDSGFESFYQDSLVHVDIHLKDFECPMCCEVFLEPTTILCGHTFCTDCLQRVFDSTSTSNQPQCPICRRYIFNSGGKPPLNITLNDLIKKYLPKIYDARQKECTTWNQNVNTWVPLFILGIVLFPKEIMKLHVFEPRYRLMVRRCLSGNGKFGIIFSASSIGTEVYIKNCMPLPDGRFLLTVVGKKRFRIVERQNMDGYEVARTEDIQDTVEGGTTQILEEIETKMNTNIDMAFRAYFEEMEHGNSFDFSFGIASLLPISMRQKQKLLEMTSTKERLQMELQHITKYNNTKQNISCLLLFFGLVGIVFAHSLSYIEFTMI